MSSDNIVDMSNPNNPKRIAIRESIARIKEDKELKLYRIYKEKYEEKIRNRIHDIKVECFNKHNVPIENSI